MKYYKQIIIFRQAYRKLHYENRKIKLYELREWCIQWCKENKIDKADRCLYLDLVFSYADTDIAENLLYNWLKKRS